MAEVAASSPAVGRPIGGPSKRSKASRAARRAEKLEKLVEDATRNYPAYLKLIYTGDSSGQSSEDELGLDNRRQGPSSRGIGGGMGLPLRLRDSEGNRIMEQVLSPESNKLMDQGREKLPTPTVGVRADAPAEEMNGNGPSVYESRMPAEQQQRSRTAAAAVGRSCCSLPVSPVDNYSSCGARLSLDRASEASRSVDNVDDKEREKMKLELLKLQDDIVTLKALLRAKREVAADLQQKLGLTTMNELRHDLHSGIQSIIESTTYQKTNAVFRSFGAFATRKLGNIRKSVVFTSRGAESNRETKTGESEQGRSDDGMYSDDDEADHNEYDEDQDDDDQEEDDAYDDYSDEDDDDEYENCNE